MTAVTTSQARLGSNPTTTSKSKDHIATLYGAIGSKNSKRYSVCVAGYCKRRVERRRATWATPVVRVAGGRRGLGGREGRGVAGGALRAEGQIRVESGQLDRHRTFQP